MEAIIRPVKPDEMAQYGALAAYVYAGRYGDTPDNIVSRSMRPEWTLGAFIKGRLVAASTTLPLTMRCNGKAGKVGGISAVGTLPEYRRQGLVRQLMSHALTDMRQQGQNLAVLWASQAAIYQRYGFSLGTQHVSYSLDPRDIRFVVPHAPQGSCHRLTLDEGFPIIRQLYIDYVSPRHGTLHRSRALWQNNALAENATDGPVHIVVYYDARQQPQGYMVYTTRFQRTPDAARPQELVIRDLAWLTLEAYLSLWAFVARHDLVGRVRYPTAPPDDPAPELFEEPRLLHPQSVEGLWVRIVDVAGALAARGYEGAGCLVLDIHGDGMAPWNNGIFRLDTTGETTQVQPTTVTPDIRMSIKALASLWSGSRSVYTLANWGLLTGEPAGIDTADRLFRTRYVPWCPDHF
jgi:predicted acetyltransferase